WHAALSPDERLVVTACADGTARVWDAATGEAITPPLKRGGGVRDAAFSPDGRRGGAACQDGTAQGWDLTSDSRTPEEALRLAQLLSGHEIDETAGFVPLTPAASRRVWQALRPKYPADATASPEQGLAWDRREAGAGAR